MFEFPFQGRKFWLRRVLLTSPKVACFVLFRLVPRGSARIPASGRTIPLFFFFPLLFRRFFRPRSTSFDVSWRVFRVHLPVSTCVCGSSTFSFASFPSFLLVRSIVLCFTRHRRNKRHVVGCLHVDPTRHERDRRKGQNRTDPGSKGKVEKEQKETERSRKKGPMDDPRWLVERRTRRRIEAPKRRGRKGMDRRGVRRPRVRAPKPPGRSETPNASRRGMLPLLRIARDMPLPFPLRVMVPRCPSRTVRQVEVDHGRRRPGDSPPLHSHPLGTPQP